MIESSIVKLSDGRNLAYGEYGHPDGTPVLFFHGTPGSHLINPDNVEIATKSGLRLIAPARPGYSQSDVKSERTLLDYPDDLVELTDQLDLGKFGVVGVSGGGPYALACAYQIPDLLTKVAVMSSPAPFGVIPGKPSLPEYREREASATEMAQNFQENADEYTAALMENMSDEDREIFVNLRPYFIATFQEAFRQGIEGMLTDQDLFYTKPWGFSVEEIRANVHLWHGETDTSIDDGRYLAEHIPSCTATFVPDTGHLIPIEYLHDVYGIFTNS